MLSSSSSNDLAVFVLLNFLRTETTAALTSAASKSIRLISSSFLAISPSFATKSFTFSLNPYSYCAVASRAIPSSL